MFLANYGRKLALRHTVSVLETASNSCSNTIPTRLNDKAQLCVLQCARILRIHKHSCSSFSTLNTTCYWGPDRTTEAMAYMVKPGRKFYCLRGMGIGMTPASFFTTALASLLILLMCSTAVGSEGQNTTCVSSYHQFEEATITNNSENTDALFSTLYKPNQPLPYSVTVLYQVRLPDGTTQRISSDPNCPREVWLWTYSPVFLMAEPSLFNRFTAYTMNYFRTWKPATVTLTVPLPCEASTFDFLNMMTMCVSWEHTKVTHTPMPVCI